MIQVQTYLKVADNSGAITVCCIKLLNISIRNGAKAGETITVVVKKNVVKKNIKKSKQIKKGQICTALILRTVRSLKRWGNFYIKANANCVAIINKYSLPYGTRILGPVFKEIKSQLKYKKIISISQLTI